MARILTVGAENDSKKLKVDLLFEDEFYHSTLNKILIGICI
jgi:hypothetical protein